MAFTKRLSPSTVVGGMLIVCVGSLRGAIAINTSPTSLCGLKLAANAPSISSSPNSDGGISSVQMDNNAFHLFNILLRSKDCGIHDRVEYCVSTVIARDNSIL